jgi:DNA ligase-1
MWAADLNTGKKSLHLRHFKNKTGEDRNYVYVEPIIEVKVRFRNWTKNGLLRTPEFVDLIL